jgi:HPt (histidine-containing phosphotransfer) domain-containing protein
VDPTVLAELRSELAAAPEICEAFISDYIALLPRRVARLRRSVESMDFEAATDAVLSLKTSSRMVGAACLGSLAEELQSSLPLLNGDASSQTGPASRLLHILDRIDAHAGDTIASLIRASTSS